MNCHYCQKNICLYNCEQLFKELSEVNYKLYQLIDSSDSCVNCYIDRTIEIQDLHKRSNDLYLRLMSKKQSI